MLALSPCQAPEYLDSSRSSPRALKFRHGVTWFADADLDLSLIFATCRHSLGVCIFLGSHKPFCGFSNTVLLRCSLVRDVFVEPEAYVEVWAHLAELPPWVFVVVVHYSETQALATAQGVQRPQHRKPLPASVQQDCGVYLQGSSPGSSGFGVHKVSAALNPDVPSTEPAVFPGLSPYYCTSIGCIGQTLYHSSPGTSAVFSRHTSRVS